MGNAVVHFEVIGKDADKLRDFYSGLFDWEINADNPMNYGIVDRESNLDQGIGIGGGVAAAQEGGEGYVTVYVSVDDVEAALQRAEGLGASRVIGPMQVPDGPEIAQFKDPDGNLIGLVKTQPME
jgi:predicted enzyme related to lactoylglutathione lyase